MSAVPIAVDTAGLDVCSAPGGVSIEEICRSPLASFQPRHSAVSRDALARELPQVVPASRLVDHPAPPTVLTGIEELDKLTGGLPRGALSEICGPASSGRTTVLLALMSAMTRKGEVCALVDVSDSFDPQSAHAAGVDLKRVLWVRCAKANTDHRAIARSGHRVIGNAIGRRQSSAMAQLEQALKATDLLLQSGGFGLVVVDLGDVSAMAARRIPLTSWFRFRRAVEHTPTVLVVVEQEACAKTCASAVVKMAARLQASRFRLQENEPPHVRIFSGLTISAEVMRSAAHGKKPVRSEGVKFASRAEWAG